MFEASICSVPLGHVPREAASAARSIHKFPVEVTGQKIVGDTSGARQNQR